MSLPEIKRQRTFFDTDQVLKRLVTKAVKGAERFVFFAERIWPELLKLRPHLEAMYCLENGRPAEEPVRMTAVTLLQFMERLPDRQAAEACAWDGRWKPALHMEVDEPGFHATTLVKFRDRLIRHGLERVGFEGVLNAMREAGCLPRNTRQRLDSSHVIGLVSRMSRVECVRETLRLALEALERIEALARPGAWPAWWERYVESKLDYQTGAAQLRAKMEQAGGDARDLLRWAKGQEGAAAAQEVLLLLGRVYTENFEETPADAVDPRRAQPPGAAHNPHDPEAQWSAKSTIKDKAWVGYKVQVAETEGRELKGPMAPPPSKEGRISSEAFDLSLADRRAICPAGQVSTNCSRLEEQKTGVVTHRFEWNNALCAGCLQRACCLGPGQSHRTLVVGEHHDRIQARRKEQKTAMFQADMRRRNGIEGTISELVRGHGLRRCRYRGLGKTQLQNWFTGAACNLKRWCRRQVWELRQATDEIALGAPVANAA